MIEAVQLAPGPSCDPQFWVSAKSLLSLPPIAMIVNVTALLLSFVTVICCGGLVVCTFCGPKANAFGESFSAVPRPASSITCGLEEALSTMVTNPLRQPAVLGENLTLMMQLAPAATELPQSLLLWNCPEILTELIESAVVPVLVSFTALAPLVVLINCEGKLTGELGKKLTNPVFN